MITIEKRKLEYFGDIMRYRGQNQQQKTSGEKENILVEEYKTVFHNIQRSVTGHDTARGRIFKPEKSCTSLPSNVICILCFIISSSTYKGFTGFEIKHLYNSR